MTTSFDVKVEVTVDGSGFDNPDALYIRKDNEIPNCKLSFPGGLRSRYQAMKTDLIEVYVGLGEIPDTPLFQGFLENEGGKFGTDWELIGPMMKATLGTRTTHGRQNGLDCTLNPRATARQKSRGCHRSVSRREIWE